MADKVFVFYDSTAGTATARPVLEYYTEDETHVPPSVGTLGYGSNVAYVMVDTFHVPDTSSAATRTAVTINPSTGAQAGTAVERYGVLQDQLQVLSQLAELKSEWGWTQTLGAKITKADQKAFADWLDALDAIPSNALWSTNPKGITIPATPSVSMLSLTMMERIANAEVLNDGGTSPQKMSSANWATLQPVWGLDWDDTAPYSVGVSPAGAGTGTLTTVGGRSGDRALRLTGTGAAGTRHTLAAGNMFAFAAAPGDVFLVECWVRAGSSSTSLDIEMIGWDQKGPSGTVHYAGSTADIGNGVQLSTAWVKMSGMIVVQSGNPTRWCSVRLSMLKGLSTTEWFEVDNLTVTRLPAVRNANAKSGTGLTIAATTTTGTAADEAINVGITRGGAATRTLLHFSAYIQHVSNAAGDAMRLQFWLNVVGALGNPAETTIATWVEYAPAGNFQHRATSLTTFDDSTAGGPVFYIVRVSKLSSVGTFSLGHRAMSALLLPRN